MEGSIFIVQPDNSLVKVDRTPYNSEALLQGLLSDYPDLLAGDQMNMTNPRRWLLVSPELSLGTEADGTGGWWIDHLFLDQDAIPTIVEVKRSSDSRIRREVVGQMLDYAAHLEVYWPAERIRVYFEERCRAQGTDPNLKVGELVQEEETDIEAFWMRVGENLSIGKMRLLFVADEIPMHLQRVVEFLNKYMSPIEVLAVEIKQFEGSNLKTLVPRIVGQTVATQDKKARGTRSSRQWDEASFLEDLERIKSSAHVEVVRKILHWLEIQHVEVVWGTGAQQGTVHPILVHDGKRYFSFRLWTDGGLEFNYSRMLSNPPFTEEAIRVALLGRLSAIPGLNLRPAALGGESRQFNKLADQTAWQAFMDTFDWYFEQIRDS